MATYEQTVQRKANAYPAAFYANQVYRAECMWRKAGETYHRHAYRQFRMIGETAVSALRQARIVGTFRMLERDGLVSLEAEEDSLPYDPGDCLEGLSEESTRRFWERISNLGVWYLEAQVKCPCCEDMEHVDSIGGCAGYERPTSYLENAYVVDLMSSAINKVREWYGPAMAGESE
jgi:hypothetical protein